MYILGPPYGRRAELHDRHGPLLTRAWTVLCCVRLGYLGEMWSVSFSTCFRLELQPRLEKLETLGRVRFDVTSKVIACVASSLPPALIPVGAPSPSFRVNSCKLSPVGPQANLGQDL